MLTLQIDDTQLEQKIVSKAHNIGKTVQDFLKELIANEVQEEKKEVLPFEIAKLDYRNRISVIDYGITDETPGKDKVALFFKIGNTAEYVHKLRRAER